MISIDGMSLSDQKFLREGLSEVLPILRSFVILRTDQLISLSENPKAYSDWDAPIFILAIYISLATGLALFIDHNSIPSYHVAVFSILVGVAISAAIVIGPMAIAFRFAVGKPHLPLLANMLLSMQLSTLTLLCAASIWTIWPQHVRTDLYVLGRGAGEDTAVHGWVCGGLDRGARWFFLLQESQNRLEQNFERTRQRSGLAASTPAQRLDMEDEADRLDSDRSWERANLDRMTRLIREEDEAWSELWEAYPSFAQALVVWLVLAVLITAFFYVHAVKAALSLARSMRARKLAFRAPLVALLVTIFGGFFLLLLQVRDLPDFEIPEGPTEMARIEALVRESRGVVTRQRVALRERFERLERFCPNVSNRGLW